MTKIDNLTTWLETRWVTPAYSGGVLCGLAICFFGAATNTMAGWLYVLSGLISALLIMGAILPLRSLSNLNLYRRPIAPVTAGDDLVVTIEIENPTREVKTLLQIKDELPFILSQPQTTAIEDILPYSSRQWVYSIPTQRRGVYHWHDLTLRTGTPLGLFWCSRQKKIPIQAIVYPPILPLKQCPIIDSIGREDNIEFQSDYRAAKATEGVTRTLRPYHYGDPMRMIHWRTSARLGEFKIRELEVMTGSQEIAIALDTTSSWNKDIFEQAVIVAASLYFYAFSRQMVVKLWTAETGIISGDFDVLRTLAAVEPEEKAIHPFPTHLPSIWLTQNPATLNSFSDSDRWIIFSDPNSQPPMLACHLNGLMINCEEDLQQQLQMFSSF
jgi:uncharacterized protein (DUF58 family)